MLPVGDVLKLGVVGRHVAAEHNGAGAAGKAARLVVPHAAARRLARRLRLVPLDERAVRRSHLEQEEPPDPAGDGRAARQVRHPLRRRAAVRSAAEDEDEGGGALAGRQREPRRSSDGTGGVAHAAGGRGRASGEAGVAQPPAGEVDEGGLEDRLRESSLAARAPFRTYARRPRRSICPMWCGRCCSTHTLVRSSGSSSSASRASRATARREPPSCCRCSRRRAPASADGRSVRMARLSGIRRCTRGGASTHGRSRSSTHSSRGRMPNGISPPHA